MIFGANSSNFEYLFKWQLNKRSISEKKKNKRNICGVLRKHRACKNTHTHTERNANSKRKLHMITSISYMCVNVLCSMVSVAIAAKFSIWLILLINYVVIFICVFLYRNWRNIRMYNIHTTITTTSGTHTFELKGGIRLPWLIRIIKSDIYMTIEKYINYNIKLN